MALASGSVIDLSKRRFAKITAFQYALWAMDWHMWTMLLKYLPKPEAAAQAHALEERGTEHDKHFSLTVLTQAFVVNKDLIEKMLELDPCKRISINGIKIS